MTELTAPDIETARQVSFDDEPLILVDSQDREVGHLPKAECHLGDGILHRAFSVFLFDRAGRVLLQQRSSEKPLWPLIWSNSCCSHPRRGEETDDAVRRRLEEELGIHAEPVFLYKFEYHARYRNVGSEHELCWVYAASGDEPLAINPTEVADWMWVDPQEVDLVLQEDGPRYSPWFKMEWPRIRQDHWPAVSALVGASSS